ncbi:tyrosine-type recombinase/integrase [Siminovitchia terrae]|uniref:tyrosine-type recombinase/integrase n=1 Tax=Siminovitchia terrae TaxID=1914933 RepID=UPI001BB2FECD|nr:tyrosine-type recombinase/integrase [Siminovitchia terrae]
MKDYVKLVRAAIEKWSEDYPQYLYITYALAGTGARISEICALKLSDLNADKKSLKIDKTLVREYRK